MAAIQLHAVPGEVETNLERCRRLVDEAAGRGAKWIVLPECFTTAVGFLPQVAQRALSPDGAATKMICSLARRHRVFLGGSFLCRDDDGEVRNAFFLASPQGLVGRHDKDLATAWEAASYVGGTDDGVMKVGQHSVGAALCWELMRSNTARRLRGRVDLVIGGSCWWSLPQWRPRGTLSRLEAANAATAAKAPAEFGRFVGAPVVHAAHCGTLECRLPLTPLRYRGYFEGQAMIADADGRVLARRPREAGPGIALAAVELGRKAPCSQLPDRYWLHRRGVPGALAWHSQRLHGRRWYRRHSRALAPYQPLNE